MSRACGGCTLCCRLVPVAEIGKRAGQRCDHQRHGKGCAIYGAAPFSCRAWSCGWLADPEAGGLSRPDRAHYVIDQVPDFVTVTWPDGTSQRMPVVQVWCDPAFPDAHRDPALREYLGKAGASALVRYNSMDGFVLVSPATSGRPDWIEYGATSSGIEHRAVDIIEVAGAMSIL